MKLGLLNTSVLTNEGVFEFKPLTLKEARAYAHDYRNYLVPAIDNQAIANVMATLLEIEIEVSNQPFKQEMYQPALVFKFNKTPKECEIFTEKEIEAIGYQFYLLTLKSEIKDERWSTKIDEMYAHMKRMCEGSTYYMYNNEVIKMATAIRNCFIALIHGNGGNLGPMPAEERAFEILNSPMKAEVKLAAIKPLLDSVNFDAGHWLGIEITDWMLKEYHGN